MGFGVSAADMQGLRIFVSYPRGGLAHTWAERVQADLQARGATAWRDEQQIREGDPSWYDRIRDALLASDAVVCVVDSHSEYCRWQKREALKADQIALPIVAFRIEATRLPFFLAEQQPVELRDPSDGRASLARLAEALGCLRDLATSPRPSLDSSTAADIDALARRREVEWLSSLLYGEFSDREDRYVSIAAELREARETERTLKGLRMPSTLVLKAFAVQSLQSQRPDSERVDDVLDALRRLPERPTALRRLAVLGDPGAGKSFSLERIACEAARRALRDPTAPVPLLVRMGLWTREEPIQVFLEQHIEPLKTHDFARLRDDGRAMLLLDAINEIPLGQRMDKGDQIRRLSEDPRFSSVVISCRERDFDTDFHFPFDQAVLQPLTPLQIHGFLHRALGVGAIDGSAAQRAENCFWHIAGTDLHADWVRWRASGVSLERFLTLSPDDELLWNWHPPRKGLTDQRGLLRIAANPFLLTIMMQLVQAAGEIPSNRAQLFAGFLSLLHTRETEARQRRHDSAIPDPRCWRAALVKLAETLQRLDSATGDAGARTSLRISEAPPEIDDALLAFSIDASVLQRQGNELRFTHQLLQESLAADALLDAVRNRSRPAHDFWPREYWWERTGWEVVSEISAEACEGDTPLQVDLVCWLAEAHPGVAIDIWHRVGRPEVPSDQLAAMKTKWLPLMTDVHAMPAPHARNHIARLLGGLDLDDRAGTGLRADGVPDIEWVVIDDRRPFLYQWQHHQPLPVFAIARYPVTNRQWQAFVDDRGYSDGTWWKGLAECPQPLCGEWSEPTAPRETINWYEAVAYCRWLSYRLGREVMLPTDQQWERAARGINGRLLPWCGGWDPDRSNAAHLLNRTSLVGLFPTGATPPEREGETGILDLVGNLYEWCLNEVDDSARPDGSAAKVTRGGSWSTGIGDQHPMLRLGHAPSERSSVLGMRLVMNCPDSAP